MSYHWVTAAIILAALGCYALGFALGGTVLLVVGGVLELWFWVRLLRGPRRADGGRGAV